MSKHRVLLLEFNPAPRHALAEILRPLAGCEVVEATAPEEAESLLQSGPIDLLVTHLHFFKENGERDYEKGADLCRKAREQFESLPIIGLQSVDLEPKLLNEFSFPPNMIQFHIDYDRP